MEKKPQLTLWAKTISFVGGVIGFVLFLAVSFATYSCGDYAVYTRTGGSWCGPFRVLYDIIKWFQT
jgi:hypothetical protein